jgi:serine/threonine protein kinase
MYVEEHLHRCFVRAGYTSRSCLALAPSTPEAEGLGMASAADESKAHGHTVIASDSERHLLGSGTVGEVFKVRAYCRGVSYGKHSMFRALFTDSLTTTQEASWYALKRFKNRPGRDDFINERNVIKALSTVQHLHIMYSLDNWTTAEAAFMLFPLAIGDLRTFLGGERPACLTDELVNWASEQIRGVCDALSYIHEHVYEEMDKTIVKRIGFHHDLKPANILLFESGNGDHGPIWKIGDFGSGAVKYTHLSEVPEFFNRKASTGDPTYSAPEYLVSGKVSRPKDIWSLGCIFVEVLVWFLVSEKDAVAQFERSRRVSAYGEQSQKGIYWTQQDGKPLLNQAVADQLEALQRKAGESVFFTRTLTCVRRMLHVDPIQRPSAGQLCSDLQGSLEPIYPN